VELESNVVAHPPTLSAESIANTGVITQNGPGLKSAVRSTKDQTESRIIREILEEARWNRRIAAERLQISYKSLLQKIRYYNLEAST
jgi:two-component system response regulator AtoC